MDAFDAARRIAREKNADALRSLPRGSKAIDIARKQQAKSWELRAATSLARLLRKQGHSGDAVTVLRPVYNRFTEGFGTADLVTAHQLLDELGAPDRD